LLLAVSIVPLFASDTLVHGASILTVAEAVASVGGGLIVLTCSHQADFNTWRSNPQQWDGFCLISWATPKIICFSTGVNILAACVDLPLG
jgi:hypothetical protein